MTREAPAIRALIVVVDDVQRQQVHDYLANHSVDVVIAADLRMARELTAREPFDVVLIDVSRNEDDGLQFTRELVGRGLAAVVLASARSEETDRVIGLELGADDYITTPYGFRELLARLRVATRRHRAAAHAAYRLHLRFGGWTADNAARTLTTLDGESVDLTGGEFELLRVFLDHPHRVLSRAELLTLTGHTDTAVFERTIDVLIARLRHKLGDDAHHPAILQTVRGEGYRFSLNVTASALLD